VGVFSVFNPPPCRLLAGVGLSALLGERGAELESAAAIFSCPRAGRVEARTVPESPGVDFSQAAK